MQLVDLKDIIDQTTVLCRQKFADAGIEYSISDNYKTKIFCKPGQISDFAITT